MPTNPFPPPKLKVVALPETGYAPSNKLLAQHLREAADWLETDPDYAAVRNIILLFENHKGQLWKHIVGAPIDNARVVGLLQLAVMRADDPPEDD